MEEILTGPDGQRCGEGMYRVSGGSEHLGIGDEECKSLGESEEDGHCSGHFLF